MTKFFLQMVQALTDFKFIGPSIRWEKTLVGKHCVTADTLARRASRSRYTGEDLRNIRARPDSQEALRRRSRKTA